MNGIASIQYGTAYDPLLTIIHANTDTLKFDWQALGANNAAGIAVYGAGLTLDNFMATGGSGYYAGLLYADGALSISADGDAAFSSAAELYGSSVTIDAKGDVTIYGDVTATGNTKDGTTVKEDGTYDELENFKTDGSITITGGSVDIYGQLTSAKMDGEPVRVPGINGMAEGWDPSAIKDEDGKPIENAHENPNIAMSDIGDRFGYTTSGSAVDGDITIIANDASDGHVNVYYGNQKEGFIDAAGSLSVTAAGDIYMDSDLKVGGGLTLTSPGEMVLDLTNIGQVQADKGLVTDALTGLHDFMHQFETGGNTISFKTGTSDGTAADAKLAVDMWNDEKNAYDLGKYDTNDHTFKDELDKLNFTVQGDKTASAAKYTYIWVSTGEQLAGIQQYKKNNSNSNILSYNFALKNDIDASDVTDYEAIGAGAENGYTGTFDGRDNRIIGLDTTKRTDGKTLTNAGIFDTIGKKADGTEQVGTVEDLRVYSGTFTGTNNAGAVAGVNNGSISNVTTFGNVVQSAGNAGGIVGQNVTVSPENPENIAEITNVSAIGIATAGSQGARAGGIAGTNTGKISSSSTNSAVDSSTGGAEALGGVAGVNEGTLDNVDSLGVTTGIYQVGEHNPGVGTQYSDNVGGIAGTNSGTVTNAYNESIVSGRDKVGGILGENSGKTVSNVANASRVTGEANPNAAEDGDKTSDYVGGLVGDNEGNINNGRNNGEITGNNYVGGLVGANGKDSTLTNLVNDESAAIIGDNYVGGIAGTNEGTISAENQDNLINRGTITGQKYVGGVAGENIGTIEYIKNDIDLIVRDPLQEAMYFGGVAGVNGRVNQDGSVIKDKDGNVLYKGTITSATNQANIVAPKADYVGGIVGRNTAAGDLEGMGNSNEGRVEGASHVGGVAGKNDADIAGTVASMIGIENSGVVIAHNGGAGGIFGENTGKIEYVDMTNKGTVSGTYSENAGMNGTGGIFGVNSGAVTHSSLKNEVGGQVMGTQNVGGLIGVNTGNITGGRDENDGYYKYQIYNNGTIQVGTWNDSDKDGMIDIDANEFTEEKGKNIGGLFGTNSAEVKAAYNTGAIMAGGSTNVGGIAGTNTNTGTLDQVFNTVMTADGQNQTINGGTNVGGIVGSNEAGSIISNAYNTSDIIGGTNTVGGIAGNNAGIISTAFTTQEGSIAGSNNGTIKNGLVMSEDLAKESESYTGFGFADTTDFSKASSDGIWKIYDGSSMALLKVFLTKAEVTDPNLVYNGQELVIGTGYIDAVYGDVTIPPLGQNSHKDAGSYDDWLYSLQIAASTDETTGFNPNNLGYDIDFSTRIDPGPSGMPDIPDSERWNSLLRDAPWDRNRNFRERKAEVHFLAGGMTL